MITKDNKAKVVATTQRHKTDVGSPEAQAAILTERIKEVTAHLQLNKHDNHARRGLLQMVGKRKRLLKHLQDENYEAYQAVVTTLGLRK
ncbi:MAG TPA: 30S ribosomal protein S15 [Magnetospirillaceae bacterium]|nr:30S ribosomal protein S15 [Magnetospirillaceae bacterium]